MAAVTQAAGVDSAAYDASAQDQNAAYQQGVPSAVQAPPAGTDALTLSQVAGYLNIVAGLMLLAALGMFLGGLSQWWAHLGLPARDEGIMWMQRGFTTLLFLVILLGLVRFVQFHPQTALAILALGIIIFGGWAVIAVVRATSAEEDDH